MMLLKELSYGSTVSIRVHLNFSPWSSFKMATKKCNCNTNSIIVIDLFTYFASRLFFFSLTTYFWANLPNFIDLSPQVHSWSQGDTEGYGSVQCRLM